MSSFMAVSNSSRIIIPVLMREYPLNVALYGICLRNIGTDAYGVMLHNAGAFTSRLWLWKVNGMFAVPSTKEIHLN
jgi:hypothetical protein